MKVEIEMVFGLAEEGANVTLNTDMQLVIKQCNEEFLVTGSGVDGFKEKHQALWKSRGRPRR